MGKSEIDNVGRFSGDNKVEEEPDEFSYPLSKEELVYPHKGGEKWLEQLIARQRSDIDRRLRPQLPDPWGDLPKEGRRSWMKQVWHYWISTFPPEEQRVIRETTGDVEVDWWWRRDREE